MVLNRVFFKEFHFKRRHELMHFTTFYCILGRFHILLVLLEIAKTRE